METLQRTQAIAILKLLSMRNIKVGLYFVIGGVVGIYLNGLSLAMIIQIVISLLYAVMFKISLNYIVNKRVFSHKKMLQVTDIPAIVFVGFVVGYYVIITGYNLFADFLWVDLGLLCIGLLIAITCFRNASGYNVIVGVLKKFEKVDSIEVQEGEWAQLTKKWANK